MLLQHLAHVHCEYVPDRHVDLDTLCGCEFAVVERDGDPEWDGDGWDETTTVFQVVHAPGCKSCLG